MKKALKITAVLAFMLTTVVGMANEPKSYLVASSNAKSLIFKMDTQSKDARVKFVDSESNIIYSENISNIEMYVKKFDLKTLKEGTYFLVYENGIRMNTYPIAIEKDSVEVMDVIEVVKPTFRKKGGMVYLNHLNLNGKKVEIKVQDADGNVIYTTTFNDTIIVEKAFNFEKANAGNYTVIIKDSIGTYSENVFVK